MLWNVKGTKTQIQILGELLDESELQICDDEEDDHHDSQSHVILPQTPGAVFYPQVVQILLSGTSAIKARPSL